MAMYSWLPKPATPQAPAAAPGVSSPRLGLSAPTGDMRSPAASSGLSPMATLATSQMPNTYGAAPSLGARATATPNPGVGGQMSNQFQFTPEQYSKDVEASYGDQLSQNAKDAAAAQGIANNYQASLQRRNASNAAIGGYSVGGGGFLAGQNMAGMEGLANAQDIFRKYSDQAVGIRQNQANYRAGVDTRNAQKASDLAYQDFAYNRGRTDTLADRKAEADATAFGNDVTTAAEAAANKVGAYGVTYGGGKNSGVGWGSAGPILDAIKSAKTPAELASAQNALNRWLANRANARAQYEQTDYFKSTHKYDKEAQWLKDNKMTEFA